MQVANSLGHKTRNPVGLRISRFLPSTLLGRLLNLECEQRLDLSNLHLSTSIRRAVPRPQMAKAGYMYVLHQHMHATCLCTRGCALAWMCVCAYATHMCVCVCVCVRVCVWRCACICRLLTSSVSVGAGWKCMHAGMYAHLGLHCSLGTDIYTYILLYIYVYVCICMILFIYIHK